jgi:hypothetical protein
MEVGLRKTTGVIRLVALSAMGATMRLKLILTTAIVGLALALALALPGVSSAAPPAPTLQDSVVLTGGANPTSPAYTTFEDPEGIKYAYTLWDLHATSGPNGENPSGRVRFSNGPATFGGQVTCLDVSGDTATITFASDPPTWSDILVDNGPPINAGVGDVTVTVTDGQPDTFNSGARPNVPTKCAPPPLYGSFGTQLAPPGDITVVDAPPTTRAQCLNDGWKQFGFKNQGQCIAFVTHGP